MDPSDSSQSHEVPSDVVPISQLSPALDNLNQRFFHAVVTLVWPFSNSSRTFSLLLAEPDFRLRRHNGQVKITFHGFCAEEVARTKVGIGDEVTLGLDGARWTDNEEAKRTPGKALPWDLHFEKRLKLEVARSSQFLAALEIDRPPSPPAENETTFGIAGSAPSTAVLSPQDRSGQLQDKWESPAFLRSTRESLGSPLDSAYDPFAEDDGYVPGKGRKRPRFSFPSTGWRLVDEPASPTRDQPSLNGGWLDLDEEERGPTVQDIEEVDSDSELRDQHRAEDERATGLTTLENDPTSHISTYENVPADVPDNLPVESIAQSLEPVQQAVQSSFESTHPTSVPIQIISPPEDRSERAYSTDRGDRLPTDTPRLHPLASPDLPTPSPIISTPVSGEYFPAPSARQDHLNAPIPSNPNDDLPRTHMAAVREVQVHAFNGDELPKDIEMSESTAEAIDVEVQRAVPLESQTEFTPQVPGLKSMDHDDRLRASEIMASLAGSRTDVRFEHSEVVQAEMNDVEVVHPGRTSIPQDEIGHEEKVDYDPEGEEEHRRGVGYEEEKEEKVEEIEEDEQAEIDEREAEEEERLDGNAEDNEVISIASDEIGEADEVEGSEGSAEGQEEFDEVDEEDDRNHQPVNSIRGTDLSEYDEEEDAQREDRYYEDMSEDEDELEEDMSEDDEQSSQLESDMEDDVDVMTPRQQQQPQRTVHPEVIVIDSDSDEEPPSAAREREAMRLHRPSEDLPFRPPSVMQQALDYRSAEESDYEDERFAEGEVEQEMPGDYRQQRETVASEVDASSDVEPRSDGDGELGQHRMVITDDHVVYDRNDYVRSESEGEMGQAEAVAMEPVTAAIHPELLGRQSTLDTGEHPRGPEETSNAQLLLEVSQDALHYTDNAHMDEAPRPPTEHPGEKTQEISYLQSGQQLVSPEPTQTEHVDQISTYPAAPDTLLPTPQATQDAEVYSRSQEPLSSPSSQAERTPDEAGSPERQTTPNRFLPRWTDGPGSSPQGIEDIQPHLTDNRVEVVIDDGHTPQDSGDEVVLVEDHSTERSRPETLKVLPEPNRRASGFHSRVSYFAPLAALVDWFNSITDTISVVVDAPPVERATSGPRHYYLTLGLSDPSMAGTTLPAQIFRPHKMALPVVAEGDVILLRNFKVQSFDHSMMLLSTDSSAWAVFHSEAEEPHVTGPPVEYGPEERTYVTELRNWYYNVGAAMVADYKLQSSIDRGNMEESPPSVASSEVGSVDSSLRGSHTVPRSRRRRKSHRRVTIHELRDGRRYTEIGSPSDKESIHELRDGTVYAHSFGAD